MCTSYDNTQKIPSLHIGGGFAMGTPKPRDEIHPILVDICG